MPLYEYECDNCGHVFEKIQSVHDAPIQQCPNCSANSVRKVFHPAGVIFKGSGWYINDSRKSPSSESKSATGSEAKTESKSEAKPETKPSGDSK